MNHTIFAVCAVLALTACSQQYTRYDAEPGTLSQVYSPAESDMDGFAKGFAAIKARDYAAAETPLMRHLENRPDDAYALLAMGAVMEQTGREAEAITYYRGAALHGNDAVVGETVSLDSAATPKSDTIRDLALLNIARLK